MTVASIDSVMAVNVKNRMIWPRLILVHHGAVDTGSASIVGDIRRGSESTSRVVMSPNGEAEDREEEPKGDAGLAAASPAIGGGALALGLALGSESPPACLAQGQRNRYAWRCLRNEPAGDVACHR